MGQSMGFMQNKRMEPPKRPVEQRVYDFNEIELSLTPEQIRRQAARCMDCGIPFCHGGGCPLGNNIPDFNELVYKDKWQQACEILHSTNNFPEMTGYVCPAPCETACTLAVNDEPVLIRHIEFQIVERGFAEGWIRPMPAEVKTGKKAAVVGSGPAGLAAAQQLARAGHDVVVYERDKKPGGLLRYGIPDFKLEKRMIDRRLAQLRAEGVQFECGVEVGKDISGGYLNKTFDAVLLAMGACQPRDLDVPGRDSENVLFAMDYLSAQNRAIGGEGDSCRGVLSAKNKNVVVIGGGDTGSDCVGTARRQGAKSITQLEILPKPPQSRPEHTPWPMWPATMRTSSSHEEGCKRIWSVMTKSFTAEAGVVKKLHGCEVDWFNEDGKWKLSEKADSEFELQADLVLLSMGFTGVVQTGLVEELGLDLDNCGNIAVKDFHTSKEKVFAAGDTVRGASLVVWAIESGRKAAEAMNRVLSFSP